jgi:hypothetical protein
VAKASVIANKDVNNNSRCQSTAPIISREDKRRDKSRTPAIAELFEPKIEKHHGRVFKLIGDGLLAEFGSVVDAVECAVEPGFLPAAPPILRSTASSRVL